MVKLRNHRVQIAAASGIMILATVPLLNCLSIVLASRHLSAAPAWMKSEWAVSPASGAIAGLVSVAVLVWRMGNPQVESRLNPVLCGAMFYGVGPMLLFVSMRAGWIR